MKKIISTCCILIIFVLFLFGCNSAHKAKLEEGVYQAENFLIEGKNADMLRITVKRDDTFDKFSPQNIFISTGRVISSRYCLFSKETKSMASYATPVMLKTYVARRFIPYLRCKTNFYI